jgi:molecular chaperone GrpE
VTRKDQQEQQGPPVVRDKRRIDPATGAVRADAARGPADAGSPAPVAPVPPPPTAAAPAAPAPESAQLAELERQVAERTADLQRLQAEYVNYRRRVERDREAVRELAVVGVLSELLPVLDDIGRARDHDELTGGFKVVAESLETTLAKLGLERFGEEGDAFDPKVHEALMHDYSPDVTEPTCVLILQPGYRVAGRVVRPARVKVAEPEPYDPSGGETVEQAD